MISMGLDVGGTNTKMVGLGRDGELRWRTDFPTRAGEGPDAFVRELRQRLALHRDAAAALPGSVGVAIAGLVSAEGRLVQAPNLPSFEGLDLGETLRAELGDLPLSIENDVNAAVVGEHRAGVARGCEHIVMLSLGTGVGGGLVLGGQLYRGARGFAAEFGHMTLDPAGPVCSCGERGHLEAFLGTTGIVARIEQKLDALDRPHESLLWPARQQGLLSPQILCESAGAGDEPAHLILEELGLLLGRACANLVNAFNPDVVVIGGGVSGCGDALLDPARRALKRHAMRAAQERVRIVQAQLGLDGAALGAALLGRDELDARGGAGT